MAQQQPLPIGPIYSHKANAVRMAAAAEAAEPPEPKLPPAPCLIAGHPTGLVHFGTLDQLADHLAARLAGRKCRLGPGAAAFGDFDTVPKLTVWAADPAGGPEDWLGAAVLLSPGGIERDRSELQAAITFARARAAEATQ